jgi:hypothetical protein
LNKQRYELTGAAVDIDEGFKRTESQSSRSRRKYKEYVLTTAAWRGFYAFLAGWGVGLTAAQLAVIAHWFPNQRLELYMLAAFFGLFCGGLIAVWQVDQLRREWEARNTLTETTEEKLTAPEPPLYRPRRMTLVDGQPRFLERSPKTLVVTDQHGGAPHEFEFSGAQLDKLLNWYEQGHTSIRKISSTVGPGFDKLDIKSERYTIALYCLQQSDLVDDRGVWTAKGEAWLRDV